MPTYLAGLNSSFFTYQAYGMRFSGRRNQLESNSEFVVSYSDFTLGIPKNYSIELNFREDAKHGMCQGYDIPHKIESPSSRILDPVYIIG